MVQCMLFFSLSIVKVVIIVLLGATLCAVNTCDCSYPLEMQGNFDLNRQWRRIGDAPEGVSANGRKCHKTEAQAGRSYRCALVEPHGGRRRPQRQDRAQNALSMAERARLRRRLQTG